MNRWRTAAIGIACLALLACAQAPLYAGEMNQEQEQPPTEFQVAPLPIGGETPIQATPVQGTVDPMLQPVIEYAQQDLAGILGMDNWWDLGVLEARSVVWPDGGLGCPTPGMAYIQVLVDGALIRLWYGDKEYEYHSGGSRAPFLCEHPAPAPPPNDNPLPSPGSGGEGV